MAAADGDDDDDETQERALTDELPFNLLNRPDMMAGGLQAEDSDGSRQPLGARDVGDAIVAGWHLGEGTCARLGSWRRGEGLERITVAPREVDTTEEITTAAARRAWTGSGGGEKSFDVLVGGVEVASNGCEES
jgi:hypothetical protein